MLNRRRSRFHLGIGIGIGSGGAPPPAVVENQSLNIGSDTLSGAGGIRPVFTGGTPALWAISGGQSANYSINSSTGYIAPASNGSAVDGDTFTLTVDGADTATITISAAANTYHARSNAEVTSLLAIAVGTLAGKTIILRSGVTYTRITIQDKAYGSVVTLTSESGAVIQGVTVRNSTNVTVSGNLIRAPEQENLSIVSLIGLADNIVITDNEICSDAVIDVNGDYSAGWYSELFGINTGNSSGYPVDLTITDNVIHGVTIGIQSLATGALVITGNEIYECYSDAIKIGDGSTVTINWNDIHHLFGADTDTGGPHPDAIQFLGRASDWPDIEIIGNRIWRGNARGQIQGIFLDDMTAGLFYTAHIAGNFVDVGAVNSILINRAKNCIVQNNTVVGAPDVAYGGAARSSLACIRCGHDETSGTNIYIDNITEGTIFNYGTIQDDNNIVLGLEVAAPYTDYTAAFDGPTFNPDTVSQLMTLFNMKVGGTADGTYNAGAIGTGYIDYDTRTYTAPRSSTFTPRDYMLAGLHGQIYATQTTSRSQMLSGVYEVAA